MQNIPYHIVGNQILQSNFNHKSPAVMFKKLLEVAQEKRTVQVTMPHVIESCSSNMTGPANLEEIPVMKQVANDKDAGSWKVDYKKVILLEICLTIFSFETFGLIDIKFS